MAEDIERRTLPIDERAPRDTAGESQSEFERLRKRSSSTDHSKAQGADGALDNFSLLKERLRTAFDRHDRALDASDLAGMSNAKAEAERILSDWFQRGPVDGETMKLFDQAQLLIQKTKLPMLNSANLQPDASRLPQGGLDLGQYSIYRTTAANVPHVQPHKQVAPNVYLGTNEIPLEQLTWPSFTVIEQIGLFGAGVSSLKTLLLEALSILASPSRPLFARHVARNLASNICSLLISGPRVSELDMGRIMSIGVWAEQMRVAIGQREVLMNQRHRAGQIGGGKARARKEQAKTMSWQRRLNEIVRLQNCNKTKACEILADEVGASPATLMKKLKNPNRRRRK